MSKPIRVYTKFLDLLTETDSYQSLQYERNFHKIGSFEIHINRYMQGAEHFVKGNIIALDKQSNKCGLILSHEFELDEKGKETENIIVIGESLDTLMTRRITMPPSDRAYDRITANAETVMKHYVERNFVNPTDPDRKIDRLEIADNYNRGIKVTHESRYKNVADELNNLSIKTNLGWGVYPDFKTKKFIFDVFEVRDLTKGNDGGHSPVIFSPDFETIKSQSYTDSDLEYRNVAYVAGQGEGVDRKVIQLNEEKGFDRIEEFVDARDVSDTEDGEDGEEKELTEEEVEQLLAQRGSEKLAEMQSIQSLEAEILTPIKSISPFQYERDFDLGDKVEVYNKSWGLKMEAPIIKLVEIHEPDGFKLEATFGEDRPTLISKIKAKFDEINGVDKQEAPEKITVKKVGESDERTDQKVADTVEYVDKQDTKYDKKATDYTNQETERTLQEAVTEAVRQDELVRQDAMAAAQKAEENAISKSVAKEIYNEKIDEIMSEFKDVDGRINLAETEIKENKGEIALRAKSTDLDATKTRLDDAEAELNLQSEAIAARVKTTDFDTEVKRINETESSIAALKGEVSLKASKSSVDGLEGRVSANETEIKLLPDEISLQVKDGIDGLDIGGTNMLDGTSSDYKTASHSIYYANLSGKVTLSDIGLRPGDVVTYSVYVKAHKDYGEKLRIRWHKSDQTNHANSYGEEEISKGNEGRIKMTATVPKDTDNFYLALTASPGGTAFDSQYKELKLEKGSKATGWSPSPNDKVGTSEVISAINLTKEKAKIQAAQIDLVGAVTANHIKSLSGLNVNDQFIVSPSGNVTFGGDMVGGNIKGSILTSDFVSGNTKSSTVIQNDYVEISSQDNRTSEFINRIEMHAGNLRVSNKWGNDTEIHDDGINTEGRVNFRTGSIRPFDYDDPARKALGIYGEGWRTTDGGGAIQLYSPKDPSKNAGKFALSANKSLVVLGDSGLLEVHGRLVNQGTRDTTTTAAANMYVASNGYFARSSSARKYKLLEEPIKVDPYKILDIQPKDWYDKGQAEGLAEQMGLEFEGKETDFEKLDTTKIKRIPGIVAEDVEEAGLNEYVVKGDDGTVEGVMYDRLWTLLIPIVKDLKNEINQLKESI